MSYIDTRDLVKRESELEDEREELENEQETNPTEDRAAEIEEITEELGEINDVRDACEDFQHGGTLIPEDDFEDYARELAEDIGAIDPDASWPLSHIDWKRAAEELSSDYTTVEYQGTIYYVR